MILFNTSPFWSLLFGKLINGTSVSKAQVLFMSISFVGVILVALSKILTQPEVSGEILNGSIDEITDTLETATEEGEKSTETD